MKGLAQSPSFLPQPVKVGAGGRNRAWAFQTRPLHKGTEGSMHMQGRGDSANLPSRSPGREAGISGGNSNGGKSLHTEGGEAEQGTVLPAVADQGAQHLILRRREKGFLTPRMSTENTNEQTDLLQGHVHPAA